MTRVGATTTIIMATPTVYPIAGCVVPAEYIWHGAPFQSESTRTDLHVVPEAIETLANWNQETAITISHKIQNRGKLDVGISFDATTGSLDTYDSVFVPTEFYPILSGEKLAGMFREWWINPADYSLHVAGAVVFPNERYTEGVITDTFYHWLSLNWDFYKATGMPSRTWEICVCPTPKRDGAFCVYGKPNVDAYKGKHGYKEYKCLQAANRRVPVPRPSTMSQAASDTGGGGNQPHVSTNNNPNIQDSAKQPPTATAAATAAPPAGAGNRPPPSAQDQQATGQPPAKKTLTREELQAAMDSMTDEQAAVLEYVAAEKQKKADELASKLQMQEASNKKHIKELEDARVNTIKDVVTHMGANKRLANFVQTLVSSAASVTSKLSPEAYTEWAGQVDGALADVRKTLGDAEAAAETGGGGARQPAPKRRALDDILDSKGYGSSTMPPPQQQQQQQQQPRYTNPYDEYAPSSSYMDIADASPQASGAGQPMAQFSTGNSSVTVNSAASAGQDQQRTAIRNNRSLGGRRLDEFLRGKPAIPD